MQWKESWFSLSSFPLPSHSCTAWYPRKDLLCYCFLFLFLKRFSLIVLSQSSEGKAEVQEKTELHQKFDKDKEHIKALMKESPILLLDGVNEELKGSCSLWGYIYHFNSCQGKKYEDVLCLDWPIQVTKQLSPNANAFLRPTESVLGLSQETLDEYWGTLCASISHPPDLHVLVWTSEDFLISGSNSKEI